MMLGNSAFEVNPIASMRKVAQRRLEGLLRKATRVNEGAKKKELFRPHNDEPREFKATTMMIVTTTCQPRR